MRSDHLDPPQRGITWCRTDGDGTGTARSGPSTTRGTNPSPRSPPRTQSPPLQAVPYTARLTVNLPGPLTNHANNRDSTGPREVPPMAPPGGRCRRACRPARGVSDARLLRCFHRNTRSRNPAPTVTVAAPPATVTATATVTVTPSRPPAAAPATPAPQATQPTGASSSITVPDAVGRDYQRAQDLWRAAGLHVMPANDALGANRLPVIDSNSVVLSKNPAAGSTVPRDSAITATIKKYTDR